MTEEKIVWLEEPRNFRYLRESEISASAPSPKAKQRHFLAGPDTATIGYSIQAGKTLRVWWVFAPTYDGVDPPAQDLKTHPAYKLVESMGIEPGRESRPWQGINPALRHPRLDKLPSRLERRWTEWQARHPRIVLPPSRLRKLLRELPRRVQTRFANSRIVRIFRWVRRGIKHYLRV